MASSSSSPVSVDRDSTHPTKAWQRMSVKQKYTEPLYPCVSPNSPIPSDKVRFVCMSDTHHLRSKLVSLPIPDGDVYIHTGDFTMVGKPSEVENFNQYLGTLPHRHKIVIAGNHDLTLDAIFLTKKEKMLQLKECFHVDPEKVNLYLKERGLTAMKEVLTNCTYLEDSETTVYGIRIYGSPWQPEFCDWGFNLARGQACLDKWDLIPEDTDVLLTHGPPIGHGDLCFDQQRAGCVELLNTIQQRVKPKYHVFGHIHEGYGVTSDGHTTYINASTCTFQYKPTNPPIVFDIDLPPGVTKEIQDPEVVFMEQ